MKLAKTNLTCILFIIFELAFIIITSFNFSSFMCFCHLFVCLKIFIFKFNTFISLLILVYLKKKNTI